MLHHEQPSVSFRLLDPRRRDAGAGGQARRRELRRRAAQSGHDDASRRRRSRTRSSRPAASSASDPATSSRSSTAPSSRIRPISCSALASDMVQHPAFAPEEIDRQRKQTLSSLAGELRRSGLHRGSRVRSARLRVPSRTAGRAKARRESIGKITRDDLVAFHRTWFVPNNALLAIVGDLTADEAFAAAEKAFGGWARARRAAGQARRPAAADAARRRDRSAGIGADRNPRRASWRIARTTIRTTCRSTSPIRILGGEGANRLFGVLRTDRGLTYGASADMRAYKQRRADRRRDEHAIADDRRDAAADRRRVLRGCSSEPVDSRELRGAQDFMSGSFPLTIETPSAIAEQVLGQLFYGLDLKELETYRDRVEQRDGRRHHSACRAQFLKPDQLSIVLVGDASAFVDRSQGAGLRRLRAHSARAARPELADAQAHLAGGPRTTAASSGAAPRVSATSERAATA